MLPRRILAVLCALTIITNSIYITVTPVAANTIDTSSGALDQVNKQLDDLNRALNDSVAATKPLQSQLDSMKQQITGIKGQISDIESTMQEQKKQIDTGYKDLQQKEQLLSQTIRDYYIKSYYDSPLLIFFSAGTASDVTQALAYQRAKTEQDKAIITNIALEVSTLEQRKSQLEQEDKQLAS